jgi:hypothetical protein
MKERQSVMPDNKVKELLDKIIKPAIAGVILLNMGIYILNPQEGAKLLPISITAIGLALGTKIVVDRAIR